MSRACVYMSNDASAELDGFDILDIQVIKPSRVIGAPVESGAQSFDNKVLDPIKVIVNGVISMTGQYEASSVIGNIEEMYRNRDANFYSVCDGQTFFNNLILQNAPHKRTVEKFDFLSYELTFIEAMFIQSEGGTPSDSENMNTRSCGYTSGRVLA